MTIDEVKALFTLAGIPMLAHWKLVNGYWPDAPDYYETKAKSPWWLVKTPRGMIRIGWRKRVIEIDWSDTDIRKIVTADDLTKDQESVHAYSLLKAGEYLAALWSNNQLSNSGHQPTP